MSPDQESSPPSSKSQANINTDQPPLSAFKAPSLQTAWHCGHTLHPSATQPSGLCPPCQTDHRLTHLCRLSAYLKTRHKPDPLSDSYTPDLTYTFALRAYYAERLTFQRHISTLETLLEQETNWEAAHPTALKSIESTSAREALLTAWKGLPFYDWRASDAHAPKCTAPPVESKKSVRFGEDGIERLGRHRHCFARSHWRYAPGRWGAAEGRQWVDTSFWREGGYGMGKYEGELDGAWENVEEDSDDDELRLRKLGEEGRLVLAWWDMVEREGRGQGTEQSVEIVKASLSRSGTQCRQRSPKGSSKTVTTVFEAKESLPSKLLQGSLGSENPASDVKFSRTKRRSIGSRAWPNTTARKQGMGTGRRKGSSTDSSGTGLSWRRCCIMQ